MVDVRPIEMFELRELMRLDIISNEKIKCIKLLRQITGVGLGVAKDFFEKEWVPFVSTKYEKRPHFVTDLQPSMEIKDILNRLDTLEFDVRKLTNIETKKMAANLFTNNGE